MPEGIPNAPDELTRGSRLARNSLLNLLGLCAPLGVAIFAIPLLIKGIGTDGSLRGADPGVGDHRVFEPF